MSDASTPAQVAGGSVGAIAVGLVLWFLIKYVVGPVTPNGRATYVQQLRSPAGRVFQWGLPAVFILGGLGGLAVALVAALVGIKSIGG